jgi:hypothetical protein
MQAENCGPFWLVVAAMVSIQLAQGRSAEELDLLSAFFTVVADNLALLSGELPEEAEETPALEEGKNNGTALQ